jgi:amidophosphoribosyltransferase
VVAGKRLIVIDDSIVRGNTQRALVRMLREAGAKEVHVRISSPPVKWPCFYGIDFASRAELIANGLSVNEIAASLGADSLGFISQDGMMAATEQPTRNMCTACFTGNYPIELPAEERRGKSLFDASESKGGPLSGMAAEVTVERPVPTKPEHAEAVSIETRAGTDSLEHKFESSPLPAAPAGGGEPAPGQHAPAGGMCNPGPDADLEALLTDDDLVPASATKTATDKD